ncbi:hypothetical protein [Leifsonia sp. SIMBA_070]|uniref:hypothetical protein n=1 Tax=Leifsonia sp. SIMBA_070 TaxID=3085810 RepID=UPI00397A9508
MAVNLTVTTDDGVKFHCSEGALRYLGGRVQSGAVDREMLHPEPMRWGANDDQAVELCRRWMVYLGASDAVVASGDARRACDLYSSYFLGWVCNQRGNVDVDVVEQAASVAFSDGRQPLIFVPGGIRPVAQERADVLRVAVLRFHPVNATLDGVNSLGWRVRDDGLAGG